LSPTFNRINGETVDSSADIQSELNRRHRAAVTTVAGLLIATILLAMVAFLSKSYLRQQSNPSLDMAVRIVVLILGLGSVVWRRTKFSTMRLQDIGSLQGAGGLLQTLEKTTLQLAMLGAGIALIGFITTLVTGNALYTYWAAAIALVVLVYAYPTKSSWNRTLDRFVQRPTETAS
jgi:FtsH-binding integral membrane protein